MMEGAGAAGGGGVHRLPEGCVSHVVSLTTPRDACRSAAVSWTFRSAAESDAVWERFLPPDYREILPRATAPVEFSSKRELYSRLCGSILIDGGSKSFSLERSTGKKCFVLSARELKIVWGDTPNYWQWISHPESRFLEVAELLNVCWLEIRGKIDCRMLSQNTEYVAFLIFKLTEDSHGLGFPQEASIKLGVYTSEQAVCLHPEQREPRWPMPIRLGLRIPYFPAPPPAPRPTLPLPQPVDLHGPPQEVLDQEEAQPATQVPPLCMHPSPPPSPPPALEPEEARQVPRARDDGWMEVEIGGFFNDKGDDGEVDMCLMETKGGHWKNGLIVEGIEVRPRA